MILYQEIRGKTYRTLNGKWEADLNFIILRQFPRFYMEVKVKQSHNTPMEAQGERRYSSYSFLTSALNGGGQQHAPAAL
jgi:hypothetical protein